jgi:hypothetical protein
VIDNVKFRIFKFICWGIAFVGWLIQMFIDKNGSWIIGLLIIFGVILTISNEFSSKK